MTYRLFYAPRTAAAGVRVMLEEIGASYDLIETPTARDIPRSPEHLALNPNGWIPVLEWEGGHMYEAAAITIFLTDRHPEAALGPAPDAPERALFLQTLVYFSSAVQTAYQQTYYPDRFCLTEHDSGQAAQRGARRLEETWSVIDQQIGEQPFLIGDNCSAADIYLHMLTKWLRKEKGHPALSRFPNVARIADVMDRRPSVQRVYGDG